MHSDGIRLYSPDHDWMRYARRQPAEEALENAWRRVDATVVPGRLSGTALVSAGLIIMEKVGSPDISMESKFKHIDHALDGAQAFRYFRDEEAERAITADLLEFREELLASTLPAVIVRRPGEVIAMLYTPPSDPSEKGVAVPSDGVSVFQRDNVRAQNGLNGQSLAT